MNKTARIWAILGVWVLGAGSCVIWGGEHLWVAGLGVIAVGGSSLAYAYLPDVGPRERQQFTVAGSLAVLFGLLLLYIGIKNP